MFRTVPRQKNTRPTNIYWLYDMRPATVAAVGPEGKPFYCGKTVETPERRLQVHKWAAIAHPDRKISTRIIAVGAHIDIRVIEIVPAEDDWASRERHWIETLRSSYSDTVNSTNGGQGLAGLIFSAESRLKMSRSHIGKKHSNETRAKIGRTKSAETKAKIGNANRGKEFSREHREKLRAGQRARWAAVRANAEARS